MLSIVHRLYAGLTLVADRVSQIVLGWIGKDRRSCKVAAERLIVGRARLELALIGRTEYATTAQAEIALQRYRQMYAQITLPEVRQGLQAPSAWCIVAVGNTWRIVDQATARSARTDHGSRKVASSNKRRVGGRLAGSLR